MTPAGRPTSRYAAGTNGPTIQNAALRAARRDARGGPRAGGLGGEAAAKTADPLPHRGASGTGPDAHGATR